MPRQDLLALTLDDLAALTNRGTVKRAQRELDGVEATCQLQESDGGEIVVKWSDNALCTFPAGKTVAEARCSCVATSICRHVIRSILAYQKSAVAAAGLEHPPVIEPWNPGSIGDDVLAAHFKKPALAAALAKFEEGLLVELVRSSKPIARFHQLSCTLRFVVPHDIRYTHCDCAEPAPCGHVPLAVWAFRRLAAEKSAGVVSTGDTSPPIPAELLDAVESALAELIETGISNAPAAWKDRMIRLQRGCEESELIWPGEVIADLVQQYERYASHDARFAPDRVAELIGELLIRCDAIRGATTAVPQLLVRGSSSDRSTDVGSARYIGLGCGVRQERGGVEMTAYLQDADSGTIVAVARDFPDPDKESKAAPRDYWQLAQTPVVRNIPLGAIGSGQLLIQGGKRSPGHRLVVGRAKASLNPQGYAWESLRAPALVENFAELRARLGGLPPATLRPRYVAEDFHVCPIAAVQASRFNAAAQAVEALAVDSTGEAVEIHHPHHWRCREGTEALLAGLSDPARRLRFVAGQVRLSSRGLVIHPVMLVFEAGPARAGIQPWIDRMPSASAATSSESAAHAPDAIADFPHNLLLQIGELILLGLSRADAHLARAWNELARHAEAIGYDRLARPVAALAESLRQKASTARWNADAATKAILELALLSRIAQDVAG